jgi:hypothetical protein
MSIAGMRTGGAGQSDDGVAVNADPTLGLSDAAAFAEVMEHGTGLLLREMAVEQRRALAFGGAVVAGVAVEQADGVLLAVAAADGAVAGVALAVAGAIRVLAAEAREVIHRVEAPGQRGRQGYRSWGRDTSGMSTPIPCQVVNGSGTRPN